MTKVLFRARRLCASAPERRGTRGGTPPPHLRRPPPPPPRRAGRKRACPPPAARRRRGVGTAPFAGRTNIPAARAGPAARVRRDEHLRRLRRGERPAGAVAREERTPPRDAHERGGVPRASRGTRPRRRAAETASRAPRCERARRGRFREARASARPRENLRRAAVAGGAGRARARRRAAADRVSVVVSFSNVVSASRTSARTPRSRLVCDFLAARPGSRADEESPTARASRRSRAGAKRRDSRANARASPRGRPSPGGAGPDERRRPRLVNAPPASSVPPRRAADDGPHLAPLGIARVSRRRRPGLDQNTYCVCSPRLVLRRPDRERRAASSSSPPEQLDAFSPATSTRSATRP